MKTNWTFALAAFCFIFASMPVGAKPAAWRDIYRNDRGWQSVSRDNDGNRVVVTAVEQNRAATAVVTTYNPNGTVKNSFSQRLNRR